MDNIEYKRMISPDFGTKNALSVVISQTRPAWLLLPLLSAASVDDLMKEELRLNAGCAGLDVFLGSGICQCTLLMTNIK